MANEVYGGDVYLIIDDLILVNEQGATNSETSDMLESTNKHTPNKRKTFEYGESTGTISANGMLALTDPSGYAGYYALLAKQKARTKVTYEIGEMVAGGKVETGTALINSVNKAANRGELVTFDISLQKDGDYAVTTYSS
jgi:hypothetical protein